MWIMCKSMFWGDGCGVGGGWVFYEVFCASLTYQYGHLTLSPIYPDEESCPFQCSVMALHLSHILMSCQRIKSNTPRFTFTNSVKLDESQKLCLRCQVSISLWISIMLSYFIKVLLLSCSCHRSLNIRVPSGLSICLLYSRRHAVIELPFSNPVMDLNSTLHLGKGAQQHPLVFW